ncbi:MAG: hypothetical protein R3Y47_04065 [Lachnospiraceae bacterium]
MRYFFDGNIEVTKDGGLIAIPFNVWEVCKFRDVINAEIILDNKQIECELLPIEKGFYKIHLTQNDLSGVNLEVTHKILLHVGGSLIVMNKNSAYDFDNPIRKIEDVNIILQASDGLCGQAVVAMLTGVTIAEIISVMDCREWQGTMGRILSTLNYYGIDHSDVICYTQGATDVVLPKCCIMMEKMGRFSHYLLHFDGKFYDPNIGVLEDYELNKLLGYMEIKG